VDQSDIEAAYALLAAELRTGGFAPPVDGWSAELVAAGDRPSYSNRAVVDDAQLQQYAGAAGGLEGLAAAVETSAARLAAVWAALDPGTDAHPVPAEVWHEGEVIRDDPVVIREFIEGNASFHLDMHLEQLRALRP
jgi:hypothetical protein